MQLFGHCYIAHGYPWNDTQYFRASFTFKSPFGLLALDVQTMSLYTNTSRTTQDLTHSHVLDASHSYSDSSVFEIPKPPAPSTSIKPGSFRFILIMMSIYLGNFTAYWNETIATTAEHAIGNQFHDLSNQNWIATAYLIGFTVTQTLLGRLSDIFGRAVVFNFTLLVFCAGTLWAGLAQDMNSFIGARVLQGVGAAGRQTVGLIIIFDLVPSANQGMWVGFFTLSLCLGMAVGPVLGALISVHTTWRWLFWITIILTGFTILLSVCSMSWMPSREKQETSVSARLKQVDYLGSFLVVAISSLICIPVELGDKTFPWKSVPIIVLFSLAAILIPAFVIHELRFSGLPIVNIRLLKLRNIWIAVLMNLLTGAGYFGAIFFLPRYFIDIKSSSLVVSGIQVLGLVLSIGVSSIFGANLISSMRRARLLGFFGGVLYAVGGGLMISVSQNTPNTAIIGYSIIMGLGSGILYQPSMIIGPRSVDKNEVANISGFLSFVRTLGGTLATALFTSIYETSFKTTLNGHVPGDLLNLGLGLADNHANYPQYSELILKALVKAYKIGNTPSIVIGAFYSIAILFLKDIKSHSGQAEVSGNNEEAVTVDSQSNSL